LPKKAFIFSIPSARQLAREHKAAQRKRSGRHLAANVLFLTGFVCTVAVVNLMIKKPDF